MQHQPMQNNKKSKVAIGFWVPIIYFMWNEGGFEECVWYLYQSETMRLQFSYHGSYLS